MLKIDLFTLLRLISPFSVFFFFSSFKWASCEKPLGLVRYLRVTHNFLSTIQQAAAPRQSCALPVWHCVASAFLSKCSTLSDNIAVIKFDPATPLVGQSFKYFLFIIIIINSQTFKRWYSGQP